MAVDIPTGHKFAFVALDNAGVAREMQGEIQLGPGICIAFGAPLDLQDHWREWLGSLQVEQLGRSNLTILATAASNNVRILDAENQSLRERALSVFYALSLVDVYYQDGGLIVGGANVDGEISIRQVSKLEPFYLPKSVLPHRINPPWLQDAYATAMGMLATHTPGHSHQRLRRGFRAWVSAMQEYNGEDRVHQFVRAVEALIKPEVGRSRAQFVHRGQVFAGNSDGARKRLGELYDLRGAAERMNRLDVILAEYPEAEREAIALRRSFQAQVLASDVYHRIFANGNLQAMFRSDDCIEQFWAEPWADQVAGWDNPIDLDAIEAQRFRNNMIR